MAKKFKWTKNYRGEWVCGCGVGHPDLDYAERAAKFDQSKGATWEQKVRAGFIHGCCGCCSRKDFPGKRMTKKMIAQIEKDELEKERKNARDSIMMLYEKLNELKQENEIMEQALKSFEAKLKHG